MIAFDCPCGEKEIILSEPGDPAPCECGREYRSKFEIQVRGPAKTETTTPNHYRFSVRDSR